MEVVSILVMCCAILLRPAEAQFNNYPAPKRAPVLGRVLHVIRPLTYQQSFTEPKRNKFMGIDSSLGGLGIAAGSGALGLGATGLGLLNQAGLGGGPALGQLYNLAGGAGANVGSMRRSTGGEYRGENEHVFTRLTNETNETTPS